MYIYIYIRAGSGAGRLQGKKTATRGRDWVGTRGGFLSFLSCSDGVVGVAARCFKWSWTLVAWGAFVSVLHHVVLQRVYLRRVVLAQHLMVLVLRGERILDVQRLVLFGWGCLHGVLQLVLGIRIILGNDSPMLDLCNNLILFIMSPTLIIKNYVQLHIY